MNRKLAVFNGFGGFSRNGYPGIWLLMGLIVMVTGCRPERKGQPAVITDRLTFVFYNVENLYDTADDSRSGGDDAFLPGGRKNWDDRKYGEKLRGLAGALRDLGGDHLPAVIGLCEVENRRVVEDLLAMPALAAGNYEVVHYHDRDSRGIDLALAYRPGLLAVENHRLWPVTKMGGGSLARGILAVTATAGNGETFHIFVSHWPSRDGDADAKEEGRKLTAATLRKLSEPLLSQDTHTHVVIMGDMNDEPSDESLLEVLRALPPGNHAGHDLVNLMFPSMQNGHGSYKYQGDWKMLDNLVVSASLLDQEGYRVEKERGFVFSNADMEFHSRSGEVSPDRTYISDHFPVYFTLIPGE